MLFRSCPQQLAVLKYDFQWHTGVWKWISFPFVYTTVPLVYIAFIFTVRWRWKKDHDEYWDQLLLVALTGVALLLAAGLSPSLKRLSTVSPLALILLPLKDPVSSPSDHLGPFREYMRQNYRLTKIFPNNHQVWEEIDSSGSGPSR